MPPGGEMRGTDVFTKTDAGRNEIQTRAMRLAPSLRSILLLVDGRRPLDELRRMAAGLHAPVDAIEQLAALGLVGVGTESGRAPDTVNRYLLLNGLMSEAVREHLGLRGYFLQLKIERCGDATELDALVPDLQTALAKVKGATFADQWVGGLRDAATV